MSDRSDLAIDKWRRTTERFKAGSLLAVPRRRGLVVR
jgi:hypothetical protein